MNIFIFLVTLFFYSSISSQDYSDLTELQSQWSITKYQMLHKQQITSLKRLTKFSTQLVLNHPKDLRYLIWEAKIYTLTAEIHGRLKGLKYAKHAKNSLQEVINKSSGKILGQAFSNLGYLHMVAPDVSFKSRNKSTSLKFLKKGLELNEDGIDSNYYYALYLDRKQQNIYMAILYLEITLDLLQSNSLFIDLMRKEATSQLNKLKTIIASNK